MSDKYRTPDGETFDRDELERGKECSRCGAFVEVRSELPPKPDTADYSDLRVADYAGTDNRVIGDGLSGKLCPDCREDLNEWIEEGA